MRLLHSAARTTAAFNNGNVVSFAGLAPVMRLAQDAGLHEQVAQRVRLSTSIGSIPAGKVATIVAGMIAGADSIEDLDALRHGGMAQFVRPGLRASTLGSFLREFTFGHVRQLEAAARDVLVELAATTRCCAAPRGSPTSMWTRCCDGSMATPSRVPGSDTPRSAATRCCCAGVSPLVATICTDTAAPVVAATRLRGGRAGSARGAASLVAEALGAARGIGADTDRTATLLLRADSAFYTATVVSAARRGQARFSITVSMNSAVRRVIETVDATAWTPIHYPNAVFDDETGVWISDAEVAETSYTAFAGTKHQVTARLVVHRIRREPPPGQDELLPAWRYHGFVTDTKLGTVDADLTHRAHAVVEQVFADLISGPLAHLPSIILSLPLDKPFELRGCVDDGVVDACWRSVSGGPITFGGLWSGVSAPPG